jgi:RNA polymerase sigma-70 factor, ECF subfamily
MQQPAQENVTELLNQWSNGNDAAFAQLVPRVMPELHQLAAAYMRGERPGHMLQTTALVNEAWLRVVGQPAQTWENRAHFFAAAARIMRHILVDYARTQGSAKHGGGLQGVDLDEALVISEDRSEYYLPLDRALQELERIDARKGRIVELRFFLGMTVEETAGVLGVSSNTVIREWRAAKAWLRREIACG